MSKNTLYQDFSSDLLDLYCKTKEPRIEGLLLTVTASRLLISFQKWLQQNKDYISGQLNNPSIIEAINVLFDIRKTIPVGQTIDKSSILKYLMDDKILGVLPIILSIGDILKSDPRALDFVGNFGDIFGAIKSLNIGRSSETPEEIKNIELENRSTKNDLDILLKLYNDQTEVSMPNRKTVKYTKEQKRFNMAKYLLDRFSDNVAEAFSSSGMPDFASQVRGGIIAKPVNVGMGKLIDISALTPSQFNIAKHMVDRPWEYYEAQWRDYNYDHIELVFMNNAGVISSEELYDIRRKYEETRNPHNYMEQKTETYPGLDIEKKITKDNRLNPVYLGMLSVFFVEFQNRLKLPLVF